MSAIVQDWRIIPR